MVTNHNIHHWNVKMKMGLFLHDKYLGTGLNPRKSFCFQQRGADQA